MNALKVQKLADEATVRDGIVYYVVGICSGGFDLIPEDKWNQWTQKPKYVYKTELPKT